MNSPEILGWIIFWLGTLLFTVFCIYIALRIKGNKDREYTVRPCICGRRAPSISLFAGNGSGWAGFIILYSLMAILPALYIVDATSFMLIEIPWYLWLSLALYLSGGLVPLIKFITWGHSLLCALRRGLLGLVWFFHYSHKH